jgi:chemotaxis protein CheZ
VDDEATHLAVLVRDSVRAELAPLFDDLRRFVDRRIAELSAEVHGTSLLLGFSETNLSGQLARIHEQIASVVAPPNLANRNSGSELEAVVEATENAANQIMAAAEVIGDWVRGDRRDPAGLAMVAEQVNAIFEACSFQDVTGQRIRRAIEHLHHVESILADIMPSAAPLAKLLPTPDGMAPPDLVQSDVDSLFD